MLHALRASRMTPIWVLLGTLLIVGFAAGAVGRSGTTPTGLVAAYVDVNGNGIDDSCETGEIVADPDAAAAEGEAVDLDGDGTISVSEAAQSDRIGGKNCNHGGAVSEASHKDNEARKAARDAAKAARDAARATKHAGKGKGH